MPCSLLPLCRVRVVDTEEGPRARPLGNSIDSKPSGPFSTERVVIDPTKGGQVEAKEKTAQDLALNVTEGMWVWDGVVRVLQVDLFRSVYLVY